MIRQVDRDILAFKVKATTFVVSPCEIVAWLQILKMFDDVELTAMGYAFKRNGDLMVCTDEPAFCISVPSLKKAGAQVTFERIKDNVLYTKVKVVKIRVAQSERHLCYIEWP